MTKPGHREVEHEITVGAPADAVYELIKQVANWPRLFPPTVHVEQVELDGSAERIRIWATANGTAKSWTSRRELDPQGRRITFRQEVSAPPVAAMGGTWLIEPLSDTESRVRLLHDYRAVDDDPEGLAWIDAAVDRNSTAELAALKANVELVTAPADSEDGPVLSFEDTVRVAGTAKDVYDFLNEAARWPERLPHVAASTLTEDDPGLQVLRMDTRTKDGSTHTTESIRVCFPHSRILYKQTTLPKLMNLHTGCWTITEVDGGVEVTSQHTVVLNPATVEEVLGAGAGLREARVYVKNALSGNSCATLGYAKDYAEGRS